MVPPPTDAHCPSPLSRPTWFTPKRVAIGTIALAAGTAATPALGHVDPSLALRVAPTLVAGTTLLSALHARWALRAETRAGVVGMAIGGGAVFGAMNAGLVLCLLGLQQGQFSQALFDLIAGVCVGSFLGAPLGAAFGTAFLPVLAAAWPARRAPTLDAREPVFLASGASLALVGAFSAWHQPAPLRHAGLGLIALGFALAALAFARDALRLRWTRAVREGRVPGYAIVAPPEDAELSGLLPVFRGAAATPPDGVLVFAPRGPEAPFRAPHGAAPLARIHRRAEHERASVQRRMALAVGAMALAVACAAVPLRGEAGRSDARSAWFTGE